VYNTIAAQPNERATSEGADFACGRLRAFCTQQLCVTRASWPPTPLYKLIVSLRLLAPL